MTTTVAHSIEYQILSGVISPAEPTLSQAAAQAMLSLTFSDVDRERMRQLAERARQGELSLEDREWLDGYERIGSLLGLLQSKARISLRKFATELP